MVRYESRMTSSASSSGAARIHEYLPALEVVVDHPLEVRRQQHVDRVHRGELPGRGDRERLEREMGPAQVGAQLVVVQVRRLEEDLGPEPRRGVVLWRVDRVLLARDA